MKLTVIILLLGFVIINGCGKTQNSKQKSDQKDTKAKTAPGDENKVDTTRVPEPEMPQ